MNLTLTTYEINQILHALAKLPYEEVAGTIQHIKEQIEENNPTNRAVGD